MSSNDNDKNKYRYDPNEDEDTGSSGQAGSIAFAEFIGNGADREKLMPYEEKHLLAIHNDTNKANIAKQKEKREQIKAVKEGKVSRQAYREGLANAGSSPYQPHDILSKATQFSGTDKQVTFDPRANEANTNEGDKEKLQNEFQLRYAPQQAPQRKFNPKPQGPM
jgi:hypothetical protein